MLRNATRDSLERTNAFTGVAHSTAGPKTPNPDPWSPMLPMSARAKEPLRASDPWPGTRGRLICLCPRALRYCCPFGVYDREHFTYYVCRSRKKGASWGVMSASSSCFRDLSSPLLVARFTPQLMNAKSKILPAKRGWMPQCDRRQSVVGLFG